MAHDNVEADSAVHSNVEIKSESLKASQIIVNLAEQTTHSRQVKSSLHFYKVKAGQAVGDSAVQQ